MDAASPPDPAGGSARILLALRHALADPLSAAVLKLDLLERRVTAPSGADPSWVAERVRAAQADVRAANRLLDLLLRLAEIAGEPQRETSLRDVCRTAGVPLQESGATVPSMLLRHRVSAEAIQSVASFAARGDVGPSPIGRAGLESGRVTLAVEGSRATADGRPERLLDLPNGIEEAEALFVARAAVEADGGRLELTERDGRLVALFSWPVAADERKGGA
jgi:signal transduction histidine kinase